MLKFIVALGGEATCAQLAQNGKYSAWYYNALGMNFGRRIKKRYNLPDFKDGGVTKRMSGMFFDFFKRGKLVS